MKRPIILITAGRKNESAGDSKPQTVWNGCDIDYTQSVARSGGAPLLLPCITDEQTAIASLKAADGLLLTGGGDILSLNYGEEPHLTSAWQDPTRDANEIALTRVALEKGIPILGICRGLQLLNVALGGTLIQDIPSQVPNSIKHYGAGLTTTLLHSIDIEPDSLLHQVLGNGKMAVNSYHHQAAKDVAPGLKINSRAKDGVIEGLESSEGKPVLSVQFHPEEIADVYPQFQPLFDWLVLEAGKK
ncbi:MAG TPA: gamma-glutamyl-gamma-aminobutyrate hydrolase family protein [Abditibacteriaceae bacterium]|jgi:putative glutamine amidotransferase